tara:strand:+ start:42 stop:263 length:222 start_codon:yes stop_codon:yes gene_type:complete
MKKQQEKENMKKNKEFMEKLFSGVETDNSIEGKIAGLTEDLLQLEFGNLSEEGKVTLKELHGLVNNMWNNENK